MVARFKEALRRCIHDYGLPAVSDAVRDRLMHWVKLENHLKAEARAAQLIGTAATGEVNAMNDRARELQQDVADLRQAMREIIREN